MTLGLHRIQRTITLTITVDHLSYKLIYRLLPLFFTKQSQAHLVQTKQNIFFLVVCNVYDLLIELLQQSPVLHDFLHIHIFII